MEGLSPDRDPRRECQGAGDELDVVDYPQGILEIVMVSKLYQIGRGFRQAKLSQGSVGHGFDQVRIRVYDLQVFRENIGGSPAFGAGSVVVDVGAADLT